MKPAVSSIRVRNFKAITDSKSVGLTPLTVFIGNNGAGKSSLIEAMALFQRLMLEDVDEALAPLKGLAYARHRLAQGRAEDKKGLRAVKDAAGNALSLSLRGNLPAGEGNGVKGRATAFAADLSIAGEEAGDAVVVSEESVKVGPAAPQRSVRQPRAVKSQAALGPFTARWQFLDMSPRDMGQPRERRRARGVRVSLAPDGSNLAEYLLEMRDGHGAEGRSAFEGVLSAMRHVLPYASDLQPVEQDVFERKVYLELVEQRGSDGKGGYKVPGWLLSTGTLRIAALLAVLRHPEPPPLLCVEEIENGLDPRTVHLVVSELQNAVERGKTQVLVTTHSAYLLDLVPLEMIVLVERGEHGPVFTRPADNEGVRAWSEKFSPGRLYTMSGLSPRRGTGT